MSLLFLFDSRTRSDMYSYECANYKSEFFANVYKVETLKVPLDKTISTKTGCFTMMQHISQYILEVMSL